MKLKLITMSTILLLVVIYFLIEKDIIQGKSVKQNISSNISKKLNTNKLCREMSFRKNEVMNPETFVKEVIDSVKIDGLQGYNYIRIPNNGWLRNQNNTIFINQIKSITPNFYAPFKKKGNLLINIQ